MTKCTWRARLRNANDDGSALLTPLTGDTNTTTEKLGGHKVADCIFYSIRAIEGGTDPVSSDQPPPPRTCSMHVIQKGFYPKGSEGPFFDPDTPLDYTVEVTIYDSLNDDKKVIGHHDEADAGDKNPLSVSIDGLDIVLVITPEKRNDYIQFMLGSQGWKSSDKNSCSVGGWDPREQFPAVSFFFFFFFSSSFSYFASTPTYTMIIDLPVSFPFDIFFARGRSYPCPFLFVFYVMSRLQKEQTILLFIY